MDLWEVMRVILALVTVLAIFYSLVKFLKDANFHNQSKQLKIIERCHLGKDERIYLIEVVDEIWLVTVTKNKIEFLKEIELSKKDYQQERLNPLNFFRKGKDGSNEK